MKKILFVAAAALMMMGLASCEKGKCACVGVTAGGESIYKEYQADMGTTDDGACDNIKAQYSSSDVLKCYPGKTLEDVTK